ncbi:spermidine synthase [Marinomonas sp. M1K-6]|uniref:Spermidine synthase n=1 Tax=Marinomonas profundi TaxID=2726122 RepID=A0A847QXQ4_9GAMM|nr:spermidine synthase [Marinomonas profundi]NLQ18588.1 spermidine synthase [Marinomonas profundi]UDV02918.1 spermidine synthase [Marinomonas profundi]
MTFVFEEIDYQETPRGAISLRKRSEPRLNHKVLYEVKMNDEFLMSSLFVEAEVELSKQGLAKFSGQDIDVVVGGLGLGYTARAALDFVNVKSLCVVDVMAPVIRWHEQGLVPLGEGLTNDPRCRYVLGDFFEFATAANTNFDGTEGNSKVHAVLLDIDHTPSYWLNPENSRFYTAESLNAMKAKIHRGGVFGLWSDEAPDDVFVSVLESVFSKVETHMVYFDNPYTGKKSSNSLYISHVD